MTTTSKEYAAALFELSVGANQTKEPMDGLETVVSALRQTPASRDLLASPAIRKVAAGGRYISPEIKQQLENDPPIPELTPRQMQVLQSMTRGLTNRDIAKQLGIRQDGVNLHVNAILQKIGAANRTEAVAIAMRKHLLKM